MCKLRMNKQYFLFSFFLALSVSVSVSPTFCSCSSQFGFFSSFFGWTSDKIHIWWNFRCLCTVRAWWVGECVCECLSLGLMSFIVDTIFIFDSLFISIAVGNMELLFDFSLLLSLWCVAVCTVQCVHSSSSCL